MEEEIGFIKCNQSDKVVRKRLNPLPLFHVPLPYGILTNFFFLRLTYRSQ